jgi:hypothetical protein
MVRTIGAVRNLGRHWRSRCAILNSSVILAVCNNTPADAN